MAACLAVAATVALKREGSRHEAKNIHKSNLAVARTSEMSEKVPESSITPAEVQGGVKCNIYMIYTYLDEGSKKGRYFEGEREKKCGKVCHHSVSLQRESRRGDANLGMRGEFRARGANLGHFRCSSDRQIRFVYIFSAHLGTSLGTQGASRHISESSAGSDASDRRPGALPRTSLTLTRHSFTRNGPCEGD